MFALPVLLLTATVAPLHAAVAPADAAAILQIEAHRLPPRALAPFVEHPDADTRARAARALGRLRDPAALAGLRPLLEDPDPRVRIEAAFALGQTPGGASPARVRFPDEPDARVRARLAEALGKQGDAEVVPTLLAALHEEGELLRPSPVPAAAAVALGRLAMRDVRTADDPAVISALLRCLHRLDRPTRRGAAFALARSRATSIRPPDRDRLLRAAGEDWDPVVRARLVRAATNLDIPDPLRFEVLDRAARDVEPPVRVAAARAAAGANWAGVQALLDDPDVGVRREAIAAVVEVEELDAGALLQPFIDAGADLDAAEAARTSGDPALVLAADAIAALASHDRLPDP
ncbi:MAG: HEAT repeat domain-containing protein, partial [Deltaproteobacteria bacterium]